MKLPRFIRQPLLRALQRRVAEARKPDFIIGGHEDPYMLRWWVIPRNKWFNIYFHRFLRSDDDRALHDHPWISVSLILEGGYYEWLPQKVACDLAPGGYYEDPQNPVPHWRPEGYVGWRAGEGMHRVELPPDLTFISRESGWPEKLKERPAWTLFITGPKYRDWGFACKKGWLPWQRFCDPNEKGRAGPGCDG